MKKEDRNNANLFQIPRFFGSYYINYRLNQILTNEKILNEKYEFFKSIIDLTKQSDDDWGDSTISQEITNGIMFETIAYCIQYIEDLFALIKAGTKKDFFIREITTYDAGKIDSFIKSEINLEKLREWFYFPYSINDNNEMTDGLSRLLE